MSLASKQRRMLIAWGVGNGIDCHPPLPSRSGLTIQRISSTLNLTLGGTSSWRLRSAPAYHPPHPLENDDYNRHYHWQVILTTMTLVFSIISAVGGIFGMNLKSGMEEEPHVFYIVTSMSVVAAISAFVAIVIYCRRKRLMFMGVPSKI